MPKFLSPPIRTPFLGNPPDAQVAGKQNVPSYPWERYFQEITDALSVPSAPPTSASPGVAGQITFDANFLYIAVAANTWKRIALVAF